MKNTSPRLFIAYLLIAMTLLTTMGLAQSRGMRLLNVFSGSLSSHSGHDGPDHK